jgi:hypothetical protein
LERSEEAMRMILVFVGFIALMMLGVAVLMTIVIVIEDLEIVDNYILWIEDKTDKIKDALRKRRGG